jgi:D-aspartate ligase
MAKFSPISGSKTLNGRSRVPVLILGRGITVLGAMRCLGRRGIPLYVTHSAREGMTTLSRWYRPLAEEGPNELSEEDLGARLAQLDVERLVLLPCSDPWALAVSRLTADLAQRFPSSVACPRTLEQLVDKALFAELLVRLDLPHPRTVVLRGPGALADVSDDQLKGSFLKPNQSTEFPTWFGAKALSFTDREEALRLLEAASSKSFTLMLQEFIPGPPTNHVFVEGFVDRNGRICGFFARRRIRMLPKQFGNSTSSVSIPLAEVSAAVETMRTLLHGIAYRGVFSAEFKFDDRDRLFKLLEVNARPWWYVDFAARSGVDVCVMAYRDALGEDVEVVTDYRIGWHCVYTRLDLQSWRADRGSGGASLLSLLRSWTGAYRPISCWRDPVPGIVGVTSWMRGWGQRRFRS